MEDRIQKLEKNFETLLRSQKEFFSQVAEQLERLSQQISGKQPIEIGETSANNGRRFGTTNSRGSVSHKQFSPRPVKLDFPRYDGKGDPTIRHGHWNRTGAEKYFSLHEIAESDKVSLVSFYLEGDGQLWFQMLEQEQLYVTWEDFKNGLQTRFGPNQFVDPFGELIQLRQTGTVVGPLAPDKKVSCFVTGLKDSIRTDVQANLLSTLTIAIGLARLYEARDTTQRGPAGTTSSRVNNTWRQGMGYPGRTSTNTTTQIKKMTADELSERCKKGLCFHCHDRYTPGHDCKKLFMIETIEGDNEEIEPEISLHAIAVRSNGSFRGEVGESWEVFVCAIQAPKGNFYG
ncbi:hypothetical protein ACOSQ4_031464 [Xanthoceras sorbifolium]